MRDWATAPFDRRLTQTPGRHDWRRIIDCSGCRLCLTVRLLRTRRGRATDRIAELLNPESTADRADELNEIAHCADGIRRAAHQKWAAEAVEEELARFTENAQATAAELNIAAWVESAELTLVMPDGMTKVRVDLSATGPSRPEPNGWIRWSGDTELDPVDRFRHLEIAALLAALSEVITPALPAELMDYDD